MDTLVRGSVISAGSMVQDFETLNGGVAIGKILLIKGRFLRKKL
jgi:hypothetical protein